MLAWSCERDTLFASCTRFDYLTTGSPPPEDEKGLSTKLRAMHGGAVPNPRSHLVVADDPAPEIAARAWIGQKSGLDRGELLRMPYNQ